MLSVTEYLLSGTVFVPGPCCLDGVVVMLPSYVAVATAVAGQHLQPIRQNQYKPTQTCGPTIVSVPGGDFPSVSSVLSISLSSLSHPLTFFLFLPCSLLSPSSPRSRFATFLQITRLRLTLHLRLLLVSSE